MVLSTQAIPRNMLKWWRKKINNRLAGDHETGRDLRRATIHQGILHEGESHAVQSRIEASEHVVRHHWHVDRPREDNWHIECDMTALVPSGSCIRLCLRLRACDSLRGVTWLGSRGRTCCRAMRHARIVTTSTAFGSAGGGSGVTGGGGRLGCAALSAGRCWSCWFGLGRTGRGDPSLGKIGGTGLCEHDGLDGF